MREIKSLLDKKTLLNILRLALGLLFLFSGFVKCVDPTGGAIKINDYFVAWGFDMPFGVCMVLSFAQNILEFIAGYLLIVGVYVKAASLVAMLFMCFFTPLTLYIALVNPVSDCGCFGDAVKLTNWETFFKNLVFLPISIVVFVWGRKVKFFYGKVRRAMVCGVGLLVSFVISLLGITNEPLIDFRPYSVGVDIRKAMEIPADAPLPEYKTTFILEKNGEQKEFDETTYPYNDSTWVYVDTHTEVISEGYVPPIKDFTLTHEVRGSLTDEILTSQVPVMLAVAPSLEDLSDEHAKRVKHLYELSMNAGMSFYVATSESGSQLRAFENRVESGFDFVQGDETMLKTITRAPVGIMVIRDGVIVAKYHIDHLPYDRKFNNLQSVYLQDLEAQNVRLMILCIIFAVGLLLIPLYKKHKTL
jgi:triosephosphate isomerase